MILCTFHPYSVTATGSRIVWWPVLLLLCLFTTNQSSADEFPTAARSQTAVRMKPLIERAAAENMIVADINVRASRTRVLFDVEFRSNTGNTPWLILLNVSDVELARQEKDFAAKGYFRTIERSVNFRGKTFHTVLWQKETPARPLVLPDPPIPVTGLEDDRLARLDQMMQSFLKQHNAAGATIAVARDGRLVYARGFGYSDVHQKTPMSPEAVLRIASVSKSLTAVTTLMLVDDGELSLDDKILPLLEADGYKPPARTDERWNNITVRHLLHHSAGFDRDVSTDPMFQVVNITRQRKIRHTANPKDIVRFQLGQPLDFAPGDRYAYSNFGYSLLGRVIEAVTGKSYETTVRERILEPCKMQRTRLGKTRLEDRGKFEVRYHMQTSTTHSPFWSVLERARKGATLKLLDPVEAPYGQWDLEVMDAHGGWVSTAPDLLRFVAGVQRSDEGLLSQESLHAVLARPSLSNPPGNSSYWYGCGWNVRKQTDAEDLLNRHNIWHHGALAGTSTLLVRRCDGLSWAVLFNTDFSVDGKRLVSLLDPLIHRAVDSIEIWPDYDLFDRKTLE